MDLSPYVDAVRADLEAAAAAGTEETRATAGLLAGALDASLRLCLLDALSALAAEVTASSDVEVELRVHGREPQVVVSAPPADDARRRSRARRRATTAAPPASPSGCPSRSRTTPRQQAAAEGLSVNAWMVRAVQTAVHPTTAPTAAARAAPPASPAADRPTTEGAPMPTDTHRFPTDGPVHLHLRSGRGTVEVIAEEVTETTVDVDGRDDAPRSASSASDDGRRASPSTCPVSAAPAARRASTSPSASPPAPPSTSPPHRRASPPAALLAKADAKTASGEVSIEQVDGDCHAQSASGDIALGTIGGAVRLRERVGRPAGRSGRRALRGEVGIGRHRHRLGGRPGERGQRLGRRHGARRGAR